jgi:hypothetical protein
MLTVPTAPWAHYIGDGAAWLAASCVAWRQHRLFPKDTQRLARVTTPGYFQALALGALGGAWFLGTLNSLPLTMAPSHSIAGALAGGIAGVEFWKWRKGLRGSTGGAFVLPLAVGIAVGRFGCLFSGLADLTYGLPSTLPFAVDLGDHVARHPVQIYESLALALFACVFVMARRKGAVWAGKHAFHAFVIFYGTQRFFWEFLKPYPKLIGPFNLFHFICAGLVLYGVIWWRGSGHSGAQARALSVPQPDDEPL